MHKSMSNWNCHSTTQEKNIAPLVTGDDEVINKGCGIELINLIDLIGLLKHRVQPTTKNAHIYSLSDDHIDRVFFCVCVDCALQGILLSTVLRLFLQIVSQHHMNRHTCSSNQ